MSPADATVERDLQQALLHQQAGRLAEAQRLYEKILRLSPLNSEAHHNLGRLYLDEGRASQALNHLKSALDADPTEGQLWLSFADGLIRAGQPFAAWQILDEGRRRGLAGPAVDLLERRARLMLDEMPSVPIKPIVLDEHGGAKPEAAIETPTSADVDALGRLIDSGQPSQAEAAARSMVARFPRQGIGWKLLGASLRAQGRATEAIDPLSRAAQLMPADAGVRVDLALALEDAGQVHDAEHSFRAALRLKPNDAEILNNLGVLLQRSRRDAEAETCLRRAIEQRPHFAGAQNNLALLLQGTGRLREAEEHFRQALAIDPAFAAAASNLGRVCQSLGRLSEAEVWFRRALQEQPGFVEAYSNLLFNHAYGAQRRPADDLQEARQYGRRVAARAVPFTSWRIDAAPARLRVGLVSGDLRRHPVGYFLDALAAQLDRQRIELIAYPTNHARDALSERIAAACAAWRPIYGLNDAAAARLIHGDAVHVLIDLAGHTAHNRLPLFAYRPAPVQVSWLGYFATTGLAEIDYLLADAVSVPAEQQAHFSETVWYLPDTRLCFSAPQPAPAVGPLPALERGHVTFGSFQNLAKINDAVLALWAQVLAAVPSARLRVQNKQLADEAVRQQLGQRLQQAGIGAQRFTLHGPAPRESYLAAHGEVDLILDTFPFPGGTTTCEALYMGVPTLTLAGDRLIGRQGASLLAAAGLHEWIADTEAQFVERARARAADLPALATLRARLREQVLASPLFDAPRFARHLEQALWAMWRRGPRPAQAQAKPEKAEPR